MRKTGGNHTHNMQADQQQREVDEGLVNLLEHLLIRAAARFAFLIMIPIMLAAGLLAGYDMTQIEGWTSFLPVFIPGFIAAAVTGYLTIRWLLRFIAHHPLYDFAIYCVAAGLITLLVSLVRGS